MQRANILFICLFVYVQCSHGLFEDRPTYGYHNRVGVPKAFRLQATESFARIIGGTPVETAEAVPYQVGIIATLTTGYQSICGGSTITDTRVLTAAHCWWDGESQARLFTLVFGSLTIFSGGTRIDISNVQVHPQWAVNMRNDIAIIAVPKLTFSKTIQAIALPKLSDVTNNFVGAIGTISGFGKTSHAQTSFPPTTSLYYTTVNIINNAVCQSSLSMPIQSTQICTSERNGRGTCDGDSGGPLAVEHNNIRTLVGVVSFLPNEGCRARLPSVYTRVVSYLTWIQARL